MLAEILLISCILIFMAMCMCISASEMRHTSETEKLHRKHHIERLNSFVYIILHAVTIVVYI